jgi:hypothetical protein
MTRSSVLYETLKGARIMLRMFMLCGVLSLIGPLACMDSGVEPAEPAETVTEQELGKEPSCPGDTVLYWYKFYGECGDCTSQGLVGRPANVYAFCEDNPGDTMTLIKAGACYSCVSE